MKIILSNRDFEQYLKNFVYGLLLQVTEDINEAYNFSSIEEAEILRVEVQHATGNRWRIQEAE